MATKPFLLLLLALLATAGCIDAGPAKDDTVANDDPLQRFTSFTSEEPDAAHVYRIEGLPGESFTGHIDWTWDTQSYSSFGMVFVDVNGTVSGVMEGWEYDGQHFVEGDRPVHVGLPTGSWGAPAVLPGHQNQVDTPFEARIPGADGWLVVYWSGLADAVSVYFSVPEGTTEFLFVGDAPTVGFTHRDTEDGFHVSTPLPYAAVSDRIKLYDLEAMATILTSSVFVSDVGSGTLKVIGQGVNRTISLDGIDYADQNCVWCYDRIRLHAYSNGPVALEIQYAGENKGTKVLGTAIFLPHELTSQANLAIEILDN